MLMMDEKRFLTENEFNAERQYREAMVYVGVLLEQGAIDEIEYEYVKKALLNEYEPFIGGI